MYQYPDSFVYMYIQEIKDPFPDLFCRDLTAPICFLFIVGSSYDIIDRRPLEKGKKFFQYSLKIEKKEKFSIMSKIEQTNREKPAIGVEPMTIALQMRCSNL